ncbi:MAG: phosphomannomutase [Paracoccaceae bacterium]|nr:phosphomannomutase [Paracoccaceae bacterium]
MTQTPLSVRDLMEDSGVAFGTSGARGLVTDMTDRVCYGYTLGFLHYLREIGEFSGGDVALAGDLRPSSPRILRAAAEGIRAAGGVPVFCGYVPTPALAHYAFGRAIPSLMVTGSHIPDDRNGIKFQRPAGEVLKTDEAGMSRQAVTLPAALFDDGGMLRDPAPLPAVTEIGAAYIARYVDFFGPEALKGLTIGVYQHSAVGRDLVARILADLGAKVLPLGRSDTFIPVDTEALRPEDVDLAHGWAADHALDAIVSTDGDSDRPLLSDHQGNWLRGDILGLLCAKALGADCVVTPVSSNTALELSGAFARTIRTRIGSPYVIADMDTAAGSGRVVCGYEANGGFLLGTALSREGRHLAALPTRDAVLPVISVLAASRGRSVAALCAELPQRVTWSDRIKNFPTADSRAIIAWLSDGDDATRRARIEGAFGALAGQLAGIDQTDGLRMSFAGGTVIHLRPSGNAPELRCYTEADEVGQAQRLNAAVLALVRDKLAAKARGA